jgi:hypothetical protein
MYKENKVLTSLMTYFPALSWIKPFSFVLQTTKGGGEASTRHDKVTLWPSGTNIVGSTLSVGGTKNGHQAKINRMNYCWCHVWAPAGVFELTEYGQCDDFHRGRWNVVACQTQVVPHVMSVRVFKHQLRPHELWNWKKKPANANITLTNFCEVWTSFHSTYCASNLTAEPFVNGDVQPVFSPPSDHRLWYTSCWARQPCCHVFRHNFFWWRPFVRDFGRY